MSEIDELKSWVLANAQQSRRPEFGDKIIAALNALEEMEAVLETLAEKAGYFVINQDDGTYATEPNIAIRFLRLGVTDEEPLIHPADIAKKALGR